MKVREIFIWLIIFVVGSLIVTFLVFPGSFQVFKWNIGQVTGEIIDSSTDVKQNLLEKINLEDYSCEDGIIPEYIYIEKLGYNFLSVREQSNFPGGTKWEDGQYIITPSPYGTGILSCRQGLEEGENINYVYCFDLPYSRTDKEISNEGVVLGINQIDYNIDLILNELNASTYRGSLGSYYLIQFLVVEANCKKET